jgi:hypothetical protein
MAVGWLALKSEVRTRLKGEGFADRSSPASIDDRSDHCYGAKNTELLLNFFMSKLQATSAVLNKRSEGRVAVVFGKHDRWIL